MERSAPPPHDYDEDDPSIARPSVPPTAEMRNMGLTPSAPVLREDDEGLVDPVRASGSREDTGRRRSESLPVYER
jgi:hypothetical protein